MGLFDQVKLSHVQPVRAPLEDFVNIGEQYKDMYIQGAKEENQLRYALTDLMINADEADKPAVQQLISNFDARLQKRVANDQYYNPAVLNQIRHDAAEFAARYKPFTESKQRRDADKQSIAQMKLRPMEHKTLLMQRIDATPGVSFNDQGLPISTYEHQGFADAANIAELADNYGRRIATDGVSWREAFYYISDGKGEAGTVPAGSMIKKTSSGETQQITEDEARDIIMQMVMNDATVQADLGTRTMMYQDQLTPEQIKKSNEDYVRRGVDPAVAKYSYVREGTGVDYQATLPSAGKEQVADLFRGSENLTARETAVDKNKIGILEKILQDPSSIRQGEFQVQTRTLMAGLSPAGAAPTPAGAKVSPFPTDGEPTAQDYRNLVSEDLYQDVNAVAKSLYNKEFGKIEDIGQLMDIFQRTKDIIKYANDYVSTGYIKYDDATVTAHDNTFLGLLETRSRKLYNIETGEQVDTKKFAKKIGEAKAGQKPRLQGQTTPASPFYMDTGDPKFMWGHLFTFEGDRYIMAGNAQEGILGLNPGLFTKNKGFEAMYNGRPAEIVIGGEHQGWVTYLRYPDGTPYFELRQPGYEPMKFSPEDFFSGAAPQVENEQ
jgi:hypothetical protein